MESVSFEKCNIRLDLLYNYINYIKVQVTAVLKIQFVRYRPSVNSALKH